jgi:outer membrane protein TolC
MKQFIVKSLFLLLLYTHIKAQKANPVFHLSMNKAVEMAYKHRPSLKAQKFATQATKTGEKKALAGYMPQVTIQESNAFSSGSRGLQHSIGVQATQLVYSFAGPLEEYKIAKQGTKASKFSEETHKDLVRYEVEASFLASWLLQRKNEYIQSLNKSSGKRFEEEKYKNNVNLLNKNDWLKQVATYSEKLSTVYLYTDELNNAQNELEYFIGKPFGQDIKKITLVWDNEQKITVEPLHYYVDLAIQNRKEIKQKQIEMEQQEEYRRYYKKTYLPSVSLSGDSTRSSGSASSSVSLNLTWNIFDGGATFQDSNKANATRLKLLMEKNSYIQQAKYEVEKAYNELAQYLKQLVAKDLRLAQAKNEFDLKTLQFKIGEISPAEFEEATFSWETEKFAWLTLKVSAALKERELIYACGYPQILP